MVLFTRTSERLKRASGRSAGFAGAASDQGSGARPTYVPPQPGSRDMRAQAVHRLQVGMFGLAAMLLLVSLASVIMQRVQTADRSAVATEPSGSASAASANDPLVDLGVAPEVPVVGTPSPHPKPAKATATH
jgi:hypothetical protein